LKHAYRLRVRWENVLEKIFWPKEHKVVGDGLTRNGMIYYSQQVSFG
jgi:hypothetical protein